MYVWVSLCNNVHAMTRRRRRANGPRPSSSCSAADPTNRTPAPTSNCIDRIDRRLDARPVVRASESFVGRRRRQWRLANHNPPPPVAQIIASVERASPADPRMGRRVLQTRSGDGSLPLLIHWGLIDRPKDAAGPASAFQARKASVWWDEERSRARSPSVGRRVVVRRRRHHRSLAFAHRPRRAICAWG